jgi:hypothetical protein
MEKIKEYLKTNYLRLAVLCLIVWGVYKCDNNTSSNNNRSIYAEENPPAGYHKGGSCDGGCSGTGFYTHEIMGIPNSKGAKCASCNGKGYRWVKD